MKKNMVGKGIFLIFAIIVFTFLIQLPSNAASFSASAGKTTMTVGESTTLTVSVTDALGLFSITSSNPSVVSITGDTSPWFEGTREQ